MTDAIVNLMNPELQTGAKNDPSGTPVGPYGHGPSGLFNIPGTDNRVFTAMMMPVGGVLDVIPVLNGGRYSEDLFGGERLAFDTMITGVTSGAADLMANQPTTDCADGPVGGLTKVCTYVNPYGRYRVGVREMSLYRAGERQDLADPITLQMMNNPVMAGMFGVPTPAASAQNVLLNEWGRRLWESSVSIRRAFAQHVWDANPAQNSGERRFLTGLNLHINTGTHIDRSGSGVCTAADSDVKDFGYDLVGGTGRDIVAYIEMMDFYTEHKARAQGLWPVEGAIVMRPDLWETISAVWPVRQYLSSMNQMGVFNNSGGRLVVDATDSLRDRNDYRRNMYLPIRGRNVPVIIDDGIPESTITTTPGLLAGNFASDIYFIPLRVMGNVPVTFFEYYNYDNAQVRGIRQLPGSDFTYTTDGGMYRHYINFKNGCINSTFEFSVRLRMVTPQLAWRLRNVRYNPLQHTSSYDPASAYWQDGGRVNQNPPPQYYTSWSPSTPTSV